MISWVPFAVAVVGILLAFISPVASRVTMTAAMGLSVFTFMKGLSIESAFLLAAVSVGITACTLNWNGRLDGIGKATSILAAFMMLFGKGEIVLSGYELYALGTFLIVLSEGSSKVARRYITMNQVLGVLPMLVAYSTGFRPLYVLPILFRAGVFPLHSWIRWVYGRVSSSSVPVFILGELAAFRLAAALVPGGYSGYVLAVMGAISSFSALYSFKEVRLKRKFSYGAIMDSGLTVFGLGVYMVTGSGIALIGSLIHAIYQSLYKAAVFTGLSSVEHHGEDPNVCSIRKLFGGGTMSKLLYTAMFSSSGIPPFASFFSRWLIYQGMENAGVFLWLMFIPVVFLGAFPLSSVLQLRSLSERVCGKRTGMGRTPVRAAFLTALLLALSLTVPLLLLALRLYGLIRPVPAIASIIALSAVSILGGRLGRAPTERVSEILLLFYSLGDIMRDTAALMVEGIRRIYLRNVVPVVKEIPSYEVPLLYKSEDAFDYRTRHLDEAIFLPAVKLVEGASKWGIRRRTDMNILMGGFVVALSALIVIIGLIGL